MPDGQVRSQEELHCSRNRRPEAPYLGGVYESGRHLVIGLVQRTEGEPKEAPQEIIGAPKKLVEKLEPPKNLWKI